MLVGLRVAVSREGAAVIVRLRGELDLASAGTLETRLRDLIEPLRPAPVDLVVVDAADLEFMDLAGVRVLLRARAVLAARGGSLVLRCPSRAVERLLDVLALLEVDDPLVVEDRQNSVGVNDSSPRSSS